MAGSFNTFQRTMLLWDELHAYNAVHVARIPAVHDSSRLKQTVARVLEERGLTGLVIAADGRRFEFRGGPARVEVKLVPAESGPGESLRAEMERQINERFVREGPFTPFRFFVVEDGGAFWLGTAYFHAIADAEPIVRLMRDIVEDYQRDHPARRERWECHAGIRNRRPWRPGLWLRKLVFVRSQFSMMRRSIRPYCHDSEDMRNALALFAFDSGELSGLKAASRAAGVTLNDFFLALLMSALAPMAAAQRRQGRPLLALGCIVNARKDLGGEGGGSFGLALGSFSVALAAPEARSVAGLACSIAAQTRRLKSGGLYLANTAELRLTLRLMSFFSTSRRRRFYAKNHPLWGGITNMNLSDLEAQTPAGPADYLRAVSTGPATPLVLSLTTIGGRVNCSLTWRTSYFSADDVARVRERLAAGVREPGTAA